MAKQTYVLFPIQIKIKKFNQISIFETITISISSVELSLRHSRYLHVPAFMYLPGTTLCWEPLFQASAREQPVPYGLLYGVAEDQTCDLPLLKQML